MLYSFPSFAAALASASALTAVVAFAVPTPSMPAAVDGDPGSCFGEVPTIVGTPGQPLTGTPGADAVITNGAHSIVTLAGDDLVCVTEVGVSVWTGSGDDRIDSSALDRGSNVFITPGPGADEVIGGPASEGVSAAKGTADDVDRDVITLGGGRDRVDTGGTAPNEDVISLGSERDLVVLTVDKTYPQAGKHPQVLRGGMGVDTLVVWVEFSSRVQSWRMNNRGQRLTADGQLVARWSSFIDFTLVAPGSSTFIRGNDSERVTLGGGHDVLKGGAGDDVLDGRGGHDTADGGAGTDTCFTEVRHHCERPRPWP